MDSKGTAAATTRGRKARLLRWPLLASLLIHGGALGGALWWAFTEPTAPVAAVGSFALRPPREPQVAAPEEELVEPPLLEETFEFADALEQVVLEPMPIESEPLFQDEDDDSLVSEPVAFQEVPLTAGRRPIRPQPPTPVVRPTPQPPTPVVRLSPPTPRPRVVHVRPRTFPQPTPRVAPSPVRRSPLRVVWAPDPRRYYPASAMRSGLGGRALVRLTIDTGGRVTSAHVVQTSGHTQLDRAAVSLAYAYRFTTGHVVRTTRLPVTFRPPGRGLGS